MEIEYKANGEYVTLTSDDDYVAVWFRAESSRSQRAAVAESADVRFSDRVDLLGGRIAVLRVPPLERKRAERRKSIEERLQSAEIVERVAPVFRTWGGRAVVAQRLLLALASPGDTGAWLVDGVPGRALLAPAPYVPEDLLECNLELGAEEDPWAVMQRLAGDPRVRYVEPAFLNLLKHQQTMSAVRRSRLGNQQCHCPSDDPEYALNAVRATKAREERAGDPSVCIAILDVGTDTRHEDLRSKNVEIKQFDAITNDEYQEPEPWDGHGTACAGLAVASADPWRGVGGVGAGCALMAVRVARSRYFDSAWELANEVAAAGIHWAWRNGASILSLSWSGGAPSTRIGDAIRYAIEHGRNKKGCVVVAAVGNEERRVNFPANLADVIAVGASNAEDCPKTMYSGDRDLGWGSNYGPELDLVAPGVRLRTTDIVGAGGYSSSADVSGNYCYDFSGTAAAAALVAGAAGLVLSANSDLSARRVKRILCATAEKVGPLRYQKDEATDDDLEAGRNDRMGHGRLNAEKAVQMAKRGSRSTVASNSEVGD